MSPNPRKKLKAEKKSVPFSAFAAFQPADENKNLFDVLRESSLDEDQLLSEEVTEESYQIQSVPLSNNDISSNLNTGIDFNNFYSERTRYLEELQATGIYQIACIEGSFEILGYRLDAQTTKWHTIYAPLTHSLPVITAHKTLADPVPTYNQMEHLRKLNNWATYDVVVGIRQFKSNLMNLQNVYPPARHIWGTRDLLPPSLEKFPCIPINTTDPSLPIMMYPDSWKMAANNVHSDVQKQEPQRVLVCGPKSAGKSSFAKYLINHLISLSKVRLLDLDPGQPLFGPVGMISLHTISDAILGPPFVYPQSPCQVYAHDIGDISPQNDPEHYIACAQHLFQIQTLQDEPHLPMIINTVGWIKGQGMEILTNLLSLINPTHIVYLGPQLNVASSEIARLLLGSPRLATLEPASDLTCTLPSISASELRTLSTMSYFHSTLTAGVENCNFSPLVRHIPWIVPYEGETPGVDAVSILGSIVDSEHVAMVINAAIAAVIIHKPQDIPSWENGIVRTPEGLPYLNLHGQYLDPKWSQCIGYTIIRGINISTKELELLSPIDPSLLETEDFKIILVCGKQEMPIWAFLEGSSDNITGRSWNNAPYLTCLPEKGAGSQFTKSRRNISRRSAYVDIY